MASYTIKYESWHTIFDDSGERIGKYVYKEVPEPHHALFLNDHELRLIIRNLSLMEIKSFIEIPEADEQPGIIYHRHFFKRQIATIQFEGQEYTVHHKGYLNRSLVWKKDGKVIAYSKSSFFGGSTFNCFAPIPSLHETLLIMSIFWIQWEENSNKNRI